MEGGVALRREWRLFGVLLLTLFTLSGTALASGEAPLVLQGSVAVDVPGTNVVFMRLRAPQGELDVYAVRDLIWERLAVALAPGIEAGAPLDGRAVSVRVPAVGSPGVYVADQLIVEVDELHAAINQSSPEALAEVWAGNLALALDRWAQINRPLN